MNKQNENYLGVSDNSLGWLLLTYNVAQESSSNIWFLDSGRSNHMIGNSGLFASLDDSMKSGVKLGNDSKVSIIGKGVINILTKNGEKRYILEVLCVPSLKHNLMSVG